LLGKTFLALTHSRAQHETFGLVLLKTNFLDGLRPEIYNTRLAINGESSASIFKTAHVVSLIMIDISFNLAGSSPTLKAVWRENKRLLGTKVLLQVLKHFP
jgi:hypothetical protein